MKGESSVGIALERATKKYRKNFIGVNKGTKKIIASELAIIIIITCTTITRTAAKQ